MKIRNQWKDMVVGLVVAGMLVIGLAAFGQEYGGDRRGTGGHGYGGRRGGTRAQQAPHGGWPRQMDRRRPGGMRLLANPDVNVEVEQIDGGVKILVTSDDAALANQISTQLPNHLEWVKGVRRWGRGGRDAAGPRGTHDQATGPAGRHDGPLQDADVDTEPLDNGLAILVTSENPETVTAIQRMLPRRIEGMKRMAARMQASPAVARAREWGQIMLAPGVDVKLTEKDNGVVLEITSDDPETVERITRIMQRRMEQRERVLRMRAERSEAAQDSPRRGRRPAGTRTRRGDAEMREIIREEIRRYMEEQEKD